MADVLVFDNLFVVFSHFPQLLVYRLPVLLVPCVTHGYVIEGPKERDVVQAVHGYAYIVYCQKRKKRNKDGEEGENRRKQREKKEGKEKK